MILQDIKNNSFHSIKYLSDNSVEKTISKTGIKVRRFFSPILRLIYLTQSEYKFCVDSRAHLSKDGRGRIFIANHRQSDDMVFSAITANESAYFVFGNPYLLYELFTNGIGLWLNGVILLYRNNIESRKSTYEKMKYILQNGGNVLIFPEGYWNLDDNGESDTNHLADGHNSDNWLIQDFNIGAFRLAQELQCEIVPIVMHYDETKTKKGFSQRLNPIKILPDDDVFAKKDEIHQMMVESYYELMEKYSSYRRSDLEAAGESIHTQWQTLKKQLVADCDIDRIGYKLDLADEKFIGKAMVVNSVVTPKQAFAHLETLTPNKQNAFLL